MSLNVVLSPFAVAAADGNVVVHTIDGNIFRPSPSYQSRLIQIRRGPAPYEPDDLDAMRAGVVLLSEHATDERTVVRNLIARYLSTAGALAIMPTEKCNFRCTYCYEKFEKGRMRPGLVDGVRKFLTAEVGKYESYNLAWFGGEPLLQVQIVSSVSQHFREVQASAGVRGTISITTNGSRLDSRVVAEMSRARIDLYHISVDGPRETHNRQRRSLNRSDTYGLVLDNVQRVLEESSAHVIFRMNLRAGDGDVSQRYQDWFAGEIEPRFRAFGVRIHFHPVAIWEASTTAVDGICLSEIEKFRTWFDLKRRISETLGHSALDELLKETSRVGALACYAGKPNHYVVGADGSLYKCTVAFDLPENRVGVLCEDGRLELHEQREKIWTEKNSLTDPVCGTCAFGASCMGIHCPLTRLQSGVPPCPTDKRFIHEYLNSSGGED